MGTDPTWKVLIRLSVPAMTSLIINAAYNVVDLLFVSRYVGTAGLAAVGINLPVFILLIAGGILIGVGSATIMSRQLGAGDYAEAENTFGCSIFLILVVGVIFILILTPFTRMWTRFLGNDTMFARDYFFVISLGAPFVISNLALNNMVYAEGNGKVGFFALAFSSVLNIFLDWVFVALLDMAVLGVALATVISQIAGTLIMVIYFLLPVSYMDLTLSADRSRIREILRIGVPAALRTFSVVFLGFAMNHQALTVGGDEGLAVVTVVFRVLTLIVLPAFGINQAFIPIASYNYGGDKPLRFRNVALQAMLMGLVIGYSFVILVGIFAEELAVLFNSEPEFLRLIVKGFRIAYLAFPLVIINLVSSSIHQIIGKAFRGMTVAVSRIIVFMLPLILLFPPLLGLEGIWVGLISGEIAAAIFSVLMMLPILKALHRRAALALVAIEPEESDV